MYDNKFAFENLWINESGQRSTTLRTGRKKQLKRVNPSRPNSDLSQSSHYNTKGLSFSEVMRIENMITQVEFY